MTFVGRPHSKLKCLSDVTNITLLRDTRPDATQLCRAPVAAAARGCPQPSCSSLPPTSRHAALGQQRPRLSRRLSCRSVHGCKAPAMMCPRVTPSCSTRAHPGCSLCLLGGDTAQLRRCTRVPSPPGPPSRLTHSARLSQSALPPAHPGRQHR